MKYILNTREELEGFKEDLISFIKKYKLDEFFDIESERIYTYIKDDLFSLQNVPIPKREKINKEEVKECKFDKKEFKEAISKYRKLIEKIENFIIENDLIEFFKLQGISGNDMACHLLLKIENLRYLINN